MAQVEYKMYYDSFEICKRFKPWIPRLANYFIKMLGIDPAVHKAGEQKVKHGKHDHKNTLKKAASLRRSRKRKEQKRKNRKREHHELEPV